MYIQILVSVRHHLIKRMIKMKVIDLDANNKIVATQDETPNKNTRHNNSGHKTIKINNEGQKSVLHDEHTSSNNVPQQEKKSPQRDKINKSIIIAAKKD